MKRRFFTMLTPLCLCAALIAQESGSITGQVLDPAGAAIAGAKITL